MATLPQKVGYGLGDMATSMFWKIFSYYLPIFYSDVYGLDLGATALLMLVTRVWDAVSDPMMGVIADRTHTRWGKYRPYLLWMALPFAIAGCLLFTTPQGGPNAKLVWAYATYILMMTLYTAINVPYASMLGVMTDDADEKTVFSSFRMFFAYGGSFLALFAWEPLCHCLQGSGDDTIRATQMGWQHAMMVVSTACFLLFLTSFALTREHGKTEVAASVFADFRSLLSNRPWWLLTAAALCSNLFNTLRGGTVAYYFKYYIGEQASIQLGIVSFLFFAGLFLAVGEVCNMVGVVCAVPLSKHIGKRGAMMACCGLLALLSILFFFIPCTNIGFLLMLLLQIMISLLTGIISPLVWSMYADVAEYAERKDGTSSTALIFSSGSMAQKMGGAIAGWFVIWLLATFGLVPNMPQQTESALLGMRLAMSWFPAFVALVMGGAAYLYPLKKGSLPRTPAPPHLRTPENSLPPRRG